MTVEKLGWALVGTGNIVKKFLKGLRTADGVGSICVVSRSAGRAEAFAREQGLSAGYGSLEEALAAPGVDIVYIGTPHSTHSQYAICALKAHKAVLCEKPVCIRAGEMEDIISTSRKYNAFFMEAMWPRFMPAMRKVRDWIAEEQIGRVRLVQASFGFRAPLVPQNRLFNPELGGGALLDAGIYPLALASMAFSGREVQSVQSMLAMGETRVDEQFMGILSYGEGCLASISAAIRTKMQSDAWIYGEDGYIHMPDFVFGRAASLTVDGKFTQTCTPDIKGNGYAYEAEEVMRCVREGKTESEIMPMQESLRLMRVMDSVRDQAGFRYPFE